MQRWRRYRLPHLLERRNNEDDNGFGQLDDHQSAFCCFPIKCVLATSHLNFFSDNFKIKYNSLLATAIPGENGENVMVFPEYGRFNVVCPADIKLAWEATNSKWGAAKVKEFFATAVVKHQKHKWQKHWKLPSFITKVTSSMNIDTLGSKNNVGPWKMPMKKSWI